MLHNQIQCIAWYFFLLRLRLDLFFKWAVSDENFFQILTTWLFIYIYFEKSCIHEYLLKPICTPLKVSLDISYIVPDKLESGELRSSPLIVCHLRAAMLLAIFSRPLSEFTYTFSGSPGFIFSSPTFSLLLELLSILKEKSFFFAKKRKNKSLLRISNEKIRKRKNSEINKQTRQKYGHTVSEWVHACLRK